MEKQSPVFWFLIAAAAVGVYLLWQRSRAESAALQATTVSSPIAQGAGYVANTSGSYINRVPFAGSTVNAMLNAPVTNVLSGNTGATVRSVLTGGASDLPGYAHVGGNWNPLNW